MYNNTQNNFYKKKIYSEARFKWREINEEYLRVKDLEKTINFEFNKIILFEINKLGLKNTLKTKKENKKKCKDKIFEEENVKQIFREAAKACHPDASGDKNIELFKKIVESKKEGDLCKFLDVAKKLKIQNKDISMSQIEKIESEIFELKKEIYEITNSVQWAWWHENKKNQKKIIDSVIKNIKHEQNKKK